METITPLPRLTFAKDKALTMLPLQHLMSAKHVVLMTQLSMLTAHLTSAKHAALTTQSSMPTALLTPVSHAERMMPAPLLPVLWCLLQPL